MIVAFFILGLFALCLWYVWDDLSDQIARQIEEIGAGESPGDAPGVRDPGVLTATLTTASAAGADSPFDWDSAA